MVFNMVSNQEITEFLLYLENKSKADFSKWLTGVNIFEILGISSTEIRHSRMLAWLLNPKENHQLRDKFFKKLLLKILENNDGVNEIKATDIILKDFSDAQIFRESKENIDILFHSPTQKFNLIIENKIFTQDHDNQLKKYRSFINSEYQDYHNFHLYLSPSGTAPIDADEEERAYWKLLSYQEVSDILIEITTDETIDDKVKYIIQEYNDNIRRNILNDQELRELSAEIYFKYKEVLDLIISNKPGVTDLRDKLIGVLDKLNKENKIIFRERDCSKAILRFRTKQLERFLQQNISEDKSDWKSGSVYFYEVTYNNFQVDIYLSVYNKTNHKQNDQTILKRDLLVNNWYAKNGFNTKNRFGMLDFPEKNVWSDNATDKLYKFIRNSLNEIDNFEQDCISKWKEEN